MGTNYIEIDRIKTMILRDIFIDTICRMILDTEKGFDIGELNRIELAFRLRNYKIKNKDNESEQKQDENTNSL